MPAQSANSAWQSTPASVLKSALRNLVAAQDKYRASHAKYASSIESLRLNPGSDVKVQVLAVTERGWRAKATHRARPGRSCVIFVGRVRLSDAPRTDADGNMAGEERVPLCDRME
jgi:CRISPR/Cas system CMR subunit Cmr4 (Cas7 group RAMP superfamily)